MTVILKMVILNKRKFYLSVSALILFCFCGIKVVLSNEPSGFKPDTVEAAISGNDVYYAFPVEENIITKTSYETYKSEEKKDTTEVELKLEPMVLGGSGAVFLGVGVAVAAPFVAPILFLGAAVLFALGAFLTAKGWKKIKAEPKKFKGEKIAIANYLVIGLVGVAASFYLLYWIFAI